MRALKPYHGLINKLYQRFNKNMPLTTLAKEAEVPQPTNHLSGYLRNALLLTLGLASPSIYYYQQQQQQQQQLSNSLPTFNPETLKCLSSKNLTFKQLLPAVSDSEASDTPLTRHLTKHTLVGPHTIQALYCAPLTRVYYVGSKVCGHKGIVHGGLIATLLQESTRDFANVSHDAEASFSVNYRKPVRAESPLIILADPPHMVHNDLIVEAKLVDEDGKVLSDIKAVFPNHK